MTVSANYTFDQTRSQIITTSCRLAGVVGPGVTPSAADFASASDLLNIGLKELQSEGLLLRTVERVTQTLTAGTASYTAAADTIDVEPQAYVTPVGSSVNTPVYLMSRENYMLVSDKTVQAQPTSLYVEKSGATLTLILYPTPDANAASLTYARVRLIRDMDSAGVTPDLVVRGLKMVNFGLAHDIALAYGMGLDRVQYLGQMFEVAKERVRGSDTERGDVYMHAAHRGGSRWPL